MIGPLDQDSKQELLLLLKRWDWGRAAFLLYCKAGKEYSAIYLRTKCG